LPISSVSGQMIGQTETPMCLFLFGNKLVVILSLHLKLFLTMIIICIQKDCCLQILLV